MLTDDQINSTARVLVGYSVTYAVGRGWVTSADAAPLTTALIAAVAPVLHVAFILYTQTRAKKQAAALQTVAAIPRTIVVTQPEIAKATPLPNVVSRNDQKVVPATTPQ